MQVMGQRDDSSFSSEIVYTQPSLGQSLVKHCCVSSLEMTVGLAVSEATKQPCASCQGDLGAFHQGVGPSGELMGGLA